MSMYPPQTEYSQDGPATQQSSDNLLFGGGTSQPQMSAGKKLFSQIAPISSALMELATTNPGMSEAVEQVLQILGNAAVENISQMQSSGSGGGMPMIG